MSKTLLRQQIYAVKEKTNKQTNGKTCVFTSLLKRPLNNFKNRHFKGFYTEKDNFFPMKFLFSQVRGMPFGGDISPFMFCWHESPLHTLVLSDTFRVT